MQESVLLQSFWSELQIIFTWLMEHIGFINGIFIILLIFFERRDPKTVWTWLLVLYFVPIAGVILYLLLGQNMHKSKMFRVKEIEDRLNYRIRKQEETIFRNEFSISDKLLQDYDDLVLYNLESGQEMYSEDNDIMVYTDGNAKFDALIQEIDKAESYIHIQYYIIKDDILFHKIVKHLLKKAEKGVEIRILYDAMGGRFIKKSYWKKLRKQGIQVAE